MMRPTVLLTILAAIAAFLGSGSPGMAAGHHWEPFSDRKSVV